LKFLTVIAFSLMSLTCFSQHLPDGREVITMMYEKWRWKWPQNIAFEQEVYFYDVEGNVEKEEVWQEIIQSPSNLHIRYNGFETGSGMIFARDSVFYFENGQLSGSQSIMHYLLLMAFDVYFLDVDETIAKLAALNFDVTKTCKRIVEGAEQYVIGTDDHLDENANHFVIDAENLWLTDMTITRAGVLRKISLKSYQMIENYPVATEIFFYSDGRLTMYERYFNITFPETVNDELFDIKQFQTVRW
jgi:hypothetical protein